MMGFASLQKAYAQDLSFSASVSTTKVGTQNQFQVTYTLNNATRLEGFRPPNFANFIVLAGPIQSSSFSTINGATSSTHSFDYFLQPKSTGNLIVPGATVVVNGKLINSNSCTITVIKGNHAGAAQKQPYDPMGVFGKQQIKPNAKTLTPSPRPSLSAQELKEKVFTRIDIDKSKAFVGEQITVEYNVYTLLNMEAAIRKPTSPDGFWVQDFAKEKNAQQSERVVINGKPYRKHTMRKVALFATGAGKHTIPAFDLDGAIQVESDRPDYRESSGFGGLLGSLLSISDVQKVPISISSDPVEIEILPLPANAPEDFDGSVGSFTLESAIDKAELSTDETATLVYTLRGSGNLKALGKPSITFPGDFEVYEPQVFDTLSNAVTDISGYKIFKYTLQPRNAGEIHIPAASFTYFDIETRQYKTLQAPEYTLKVSAGKNAKLAPRRGLPQDIHDIVANDNMQKNVINLLAENKWYWLAFLLPLVLFVLASFYARQKRLSTKTPEQIEHTKLVNAAAQRLSIAHETLREENATGFYNETHKAVWLYISDKLGVPLSKLNKETADELLATKYVDPTTRALLTSTMAHCEEILYSGSKEPSVSDMKRTYDDAITIITNIEEQVA
ncbi:MAG: hypothetical protein RL660_723 [Bacteroidota bacterium]|jgi:hypothetical protein